jgi:hypothetical protein
MTVYHGLTASLFAAIFLENAAPRRPDDGAVSPVNHVHCGEASTAIIGEIGNNAACALLRRAQFSLS